MGKTLIPDAKRSDIFRIEPERLTLITDKSHPLYDERVHDAPDESLVKNIMRYGVKVPIIINKNGDGLEVVDGRGRTKAALEANRRLAESGSITLLVPVIAEKGSEDNLIGVMILANEQRREDTVLNKGAKARRMKDYGASDDDIATAFGVSVNTVRNWLFADALPVAVKESINNGEISATEAVQNKSKSREKQIEEVKRPKMKTRREIESEIERIKSEPIQDAGCLIKINILEWVLNV